MKKLFKVLLSLALSLVSVFAVVGAAGCSKDDTITVCASDVPHAEVLNGVVKEELKKKKEELKTEEEELFNNHQDKPKEDDKEIENKINNTDLQIYDFLKGMN